MAAGGEAKRSFSGLLAKSHEQIAICSQSLVSLFDISETSTAPDDSAGQTRGGGRGRRFALLLGVFAIVAGAWQFAAPGSTQHDDSHITSRRQAVTSPTVSAPQVSISTVEGVDVSAARQVTLNAILQHVSAGGMQAMHGGSTVAPAVSALLAAQRAYTDAVTSAGGRRDAGEDPIVAQRTRELYTSTLAYVATPDGANAVQQLVATDPNYAAADAALNTNRAAECEQLRTAFDGPMAQISQATRDCMCDNTKAFTYCRMLLANEMHTSTKDTASNTQPGAMDRIKAGTPEPTIAQPTQLAATGNSSVQRRESEGVAFYNPSTGEFGAEVCVQAEGVLGVCVHAEGKGVTPFYKVERDANTNEVTIANCPAALSGECEERDPEGFYYSLSDYAQAKASLGVSVCLMIPGVSEVLGAFGIRACLDLLTLSIYPLQGPVGQVSTGWQLFVVKYTLFAKYKMGKSPLCPQDWDTTTPLLQSMCENPSVYQKYAARFEEEFFCNLEDGQAAVGATLAVDMWFWSDEWEWVVEPARRPVPECAEYGFEPIPGPVPGAYDGFDCYDARRAYLIAYSDVAQDTTYSTDPRGHFTAKGQAEGRVWPGKVCLHSELNCIAAQTRYWDDYPEVKADILDHGKMGGAWRHYQDHTVNGNENNIWHGELCKFDAFDFPACPASEAKYLATYPDAAAYIRGTTDEPGAAFAHYLNFGKYKSYRWDSSPCNKYVACPAALDQYRKDYPDVAAHPQYGPDPYLHYTTIGKAENRWWAGDLCRTEVVCPASSYNYVRSGNWVDTPAEAFPQYIAQGKSWGLHWNGQVCQE